MVEYKSEDDLFVSGHTACAGCGAAIIVRNIMRALGKDVIIVNATSCLEIFSSCYPQSAWKVPYIHVTFENAAAVATGIAKTLESKGNDHTKTVVISGDGSAYDIGIGIMSGAMERNENILYICYDNEAYMNCLSKSTMIMTKKGLRKITEIKIGDKVYAFDQKQHKPVLKKCTGVFENGVRPIYNLETLHHSIKSTPNHPFLILQRNGRGRKNCFVWKTLSKLKEGDEIIILKRLDNNKSVKFNFKKVRKGVSDFLVDNEYFSTEKIRKIKCIGKESVLDLRVEDAHNFIADGIVVHNTGIQRSSATPYKAWTTTSQIGKKIKGKQEPKKNLTEIVRAHGVPYAATSTAGHITDLQRKITKAKEIKGFRFINVLSPCVPGWKYDPALTVKLSKLAVETGLWKVYEVEDGKETVNIKPNFVPVEEYLKHQKRFKHLTPEDIKIIQENVNKYWKR